MQRKALYTALESQNHFATFKLPYILHAIFRWMFFQDQPKVSLSLNFRNIPIDVEAVYVISELQIHAEHSPPGSGSVKHCLQYRLTKPSKNCFGTGYISPAVVQVINWLQLFPIHYCISLDLRQQCSRFSMRSQTKEHIVCSITTHAAYNGWDIVLHEF